MRENLEEELDCHFAYFSGASGNINMSGRIKGETITKDYVEHGEALADYAVLASANYQQQDVGNVQIIKRTVLGKALPTGETEIGLPVYAFSIGNIGFVTASYEMFNACGMEIKEKSPFDVTFVVTYANGHSGYIPDQRIWDAYDCYEERQCKFVRGTAEQLVAEHLDMLNEIYETRK